MDIENENLIIIKKHNRKIVQRAFQNSFTNANYKFPKTTIIPAPYSQTSESISICSRVSETYDLHQQKLKFNILEDESEKMDPISSIFKIKQKGNYRNTQDQRLRTLMTSKNDKSEQKLAKKQFLSLTPQKESHLKTQKPTSIERTAGINLSKRKQLDFSCQKFKNKNISNYSLSFIEKIQEMTNKCFESDQNHSQQDHQNEVIFYDKKLELTKQTFTKKAKIALSNKLTTDSTPTIHHKTTSSNKSNHQGGMSIIKLQQNITVSPFLYD